MRLYILNAIKVAYRTEPLILYLYFTSTPVGLHSGRYRRRGNTHEPEANLLYYE